MSVIIDASVTLAWIYDDERSKAVENIFESIGELGAWVPAIWHIEVANALLQSTRSRRIDRAYLEGAFADLTELPISVDPETNTFAWDRTLEYAQRFRLTAYDACYLELAQRRGLPLATLDRDLLDAGRALGLELLGA